MINQKKLLKTLIFACGILFWTQAAPVKAQFEERVPIKKIPKTSRPSSVKPSGTRPPVVKIQRVINTVVEERITPTSNLTVFTEAGAMVRLEPLKPGLKKISKTADKDGGAVFENLPPATYKIITEKNGFETQQEDKFEVQPKKTRKIVMDLKPITYDLTIETNINDGEVRYALAEYKGVGQDGSLITKDKENNAYCIVPIKDKKAVIKGLKKDYYNIDIIPGSSDIQYSRLKTAVDVAKEAQDEENTPGDKSLSFKLDLDKKISEGIFNASAWTGADWNNLAGWKLNKKMKTDGLPGIILPRNELYRYYANFEMISDVRSLDDKTIGFVLRAEDEKNYYLVQISGEKAADPLVVKPFIVKNGEARQLSPFPISHFSKFIKAKKSFRVMIKGEQNRFKIFIEDDGGEFRDVGVVEDPNNNFRKGAVGIAGDKDSDFEVGSFMVCANKCVN
jgi:hypothetical protein